MILINRSKTDNVKISKGPRFITQLEEFLINFIFPIILVAGSVGITALYVVPAYKKIPVLKAEVDKENQKVEILQAKVEQLTDLERDKDLVIADLVKMSWALEERDKVPELTEQVRLMSADSGVTFKSLNYANVNQSDGVSVSGPSSSLTPSPELYREEKVTVEVGLEGLSSAITFLKTSENSIRLFKVESLKIISNQQQNYAQIIMASPYLNPAFSSYSQTSAPIDLNDGVYRSYMEKLDTFKNYAKEIDASLPKI